MTTLISYAAVQDFNGSVANEWEARFSQDIGNNNNIRVYSGPIYDPLFINVDYVDVSDAIGSPDLKWYVGKNSVDSGNNLQIYFEQSPAANVNMYGFATFTADGIRISTATAAIEGEALLFASAGVTTNGSASIAADGSLEVSAGRQTDGSAAITRDATLVATAKIVGEEWTTVSAENEVWYEN
jgi:hypothetical protein